MEDLPHCQSQLQRWQGTLYMLRNTLLFVITSSVPGLTPQLLPPNPSPAPGDSSLGTPETERIYLASKPRAQRSPPPNRELTCAGPAQGRVAHVASSAPGQREEALLKTPKVVSKALCPLQSGWGGEAQRGQSHVRLPVHPSPASQEPGRDSRRGKAASGQLPTGRNPHWGGGGRAGSEQEAVGVCVAQLRWPAYLSHWRPT